MFCITMFTSHTLEIMAPPHRNVLKLLTFAFSFLARHVLTLWILKVVLSISMATKALASWINELALLSFYLHK